VSFFAYFALLVYCDLLRSEDWGFEADYRANRMVLTRIVPGSPADRAGLQPHDIVATADGKTIGGVLDWTVVDSNVMFDRPIALSLQRNGQPVAASIVLRQGSWSFLRTGLGLFILATLGVQLVALILALVIVLKRPDDAVARAGAWLLATVGVFKIVLPGRIAAVWRDLPVAVSALFWLPHVSDVAAAAVFFTFFASFPRKYSTRPATGWCCGCRWRSRIGVLALVAHARSRLWLSSLDRHFFREHYNAQQILRQVSDDIRRVGDFERVAPRVVALIETALHPEFVALLVRQPHEAVGTLR
jgi:hypothetical protein